jgi:phenylalanyl-tRNA synthetase alpha chain
VVRDDPTNNVPDIIFSRLGMQLHRRDQHPLGILKNAIFEYFDTSYSNKFDKFDDLCPIVSVKQVYLRIRITIHSQLHFYNVFLCLTSVARMTTQDSCCICNYIS